MRKRNEKLEELLEDAQSKLTDLQRQVALSSPSPRRPSKEDKAALSALAEEVEVLRADKATLEFKLKSLSQVLEEEKAARKQSNTEAHAAKTQQSQIMQQRSELEARLQGIGKELASQQRARQLAIDRMREMEGLVSLPDCFLTA
jgi:chromosome segregation ATPase